VSAPICSSSSLDLLYLLHWLPNDFRIKFKLVKLAFTSRSSSFPPYLASLVSPYTPSRNLRSSNTHLLTVPTYRLQRATRDFRAAAPIQYLILFRTTSEPPPPYLFLLPILKLFISNRLFRPSSILSPRLRFI
jgi:hypothetical protein